MGVPSPLVASPRDELHGDTRRDSTGQDGQCPGGERRCALQGKDSLESHRGAEKPRRCVLKHSSHARFLLACVAVMPI